jgi:hypothetical protein
MPRSPVRVILFLVLVIYCKAWGQTIPIRRYTTEDRLPSNVIHSITRQRLPMPEKRVANEYLVIFSDLVRQNMTNVSRGFTTLQQELNLADNYNLATI